MIKRRSVAGRRIGRLARRDTEVGGGAAFPLETLERRVLMATTYYVALGGSDGNVGDLSRPLRTIQEAASRAAAGDTVLVRGGVYRETVTVPHSGTAAAPITISAYAGETVTVSGADVLTGWAAHSGSIYKAPQSLDLGEGNNQVFVDGQMMVEARWPNTTLDVSRPKKDTVDAITSMYAGDASYATITDDELVGFSAGAWDGGTIHIASGQSWVTQSGTITSSGPARLSFDYVQRLNPKSGRFETPEPGDPYFLTGKFVALDAPGEWFYDGGDDRLYLWTAAGDSPAGHTVEVKRRKYAFDLSAVSNVTVRGIDVFAATIVAGAATSNIVLDGIDAKYVGHFSDSETGWEVPADSGIFIAGTDSVVRNSTVAFGAGNGILLNGARNRVENTVVHDVGYSGANGSGIRAVGAAHFIRNNTVYNVGRSGILASRLVAGRVVYNLVHDVMLQTTDGGGVYTFGTDGQGTEIAYNRIYNVTTGGFGGVGVYLDNGSTNHVVHHNLTYNVNHGTKLNPPGPYNQVFNNTFVATSRGVASSGTKDMTGTAFRNNNFTKQVDIGSTAIQEANVYAGADPQFVNAANGDFRLQATSPAVDVGVKLGAYTDGYTGSGPDAGAFEYGRTPWTAGASASLRVPDVVAPAAPKGLTATATAAGVLLNWADVLDTDRSGYHVYRASSSTGPFTRLTDLPIGPSQYLDQTAPLGATSYYRVAAVDSSANVSPVTSTGVLLPTPAAAPAAPVNLAAVPASETQVDLAWAVVPDVTGYRVERKAPGETAFREIARTDVPRFRDGGLTAGGTYSYRVRAENLKGLSGYGNTAAGSPLTAPAGLTLTVVSGMRSDLAWTNVVGETAYYVQRGDDADGPWLDVGYATPDVTTFSDLSVPTGESYYYRVLALGPGGFSRPSDVVSTVAEESAYSSLDIASTPAGRTAVVAADTAFDIVAGGRNIFGPADGFRFVYQPVTGDFDVRVRLTSLTAVVSTTKAGLMARESLNADSRNVFSHATAASGELRYSRRLDTAGDTVISSSGVRATYPNLWLRLRRAGNVFTAFGSVDGANWVQTGSDTLAVGPTVFVGMAVSAQSTTQTTTARFRELTQQVTPVPVIPAAPASLTATAASPTQIDLRWSASAGAASYRIERMGPGESGFTEIAADVAGTSFRDSAARAQSAYVYRVRAQNAAGRSAYSPTASVTTPAAVPDAPTGLLATATAPRVIELEWTAAPGAKTYRVERRGPTDSAFAQIASGLTSSGYDDTTVAPETTYTYRVRAENAAGLSAYSASVSETTPREVVVDAYAGDDVGRPTPAGSTTTVVDGKAYDDTAGGADIIGTADEFHFAHRQRAGDFDVRVRVQSLTAAHDWTKAGLMARESLSESSRNVFVMATPGASGYRMSSRFSDGGTTLATGTGIVSYPSTWVRLKRQGNVFTGYRSTDGINWQLVGSRNISLPDTVHFGMAVTSHNTGKTATAQFRDLSDVPPAPATVASPVKTTTSAKPPSGVTRQVLGR
jgi:fibronectin type 3 domain-containing protein/regulation of enolase protein 1 (concanavalin A-like superfamily)